MLMDLKLQAKCEGETRVGMNIVRVDWCREEVDKMDKEFTVVRKYKSIALTTGKMRNLGQVIVDQGGWNDQAAIKGSLIACAQCLAMGHRDVSTESSSSKARNCSKNVGLILKIMWEVLLSLFRRTSHRIRPP